MTDTPDHSIHTRCPECGTQFRLQSDQLQAASGLVRCGVCMHIFNASNNTESTEATTPAIDKDTSAEAEFVTANTDAPTPLETETQLDAEWDTETNGAPHNSNRDNLETNTPDTEQTGDSTKDITAEPSSAVSASDSHNPSTDTASAEHRQDAPAEHLANDTDSDLNLTPQSPPESAPNTPSEPEPSPLDLLNSLSTHDHGFEHHQTQAHYRRRIWIPLISLSVLLLAGQILFWQQERALNAPYTQALLSFCEQQSWPCQQWLSTLNTSTETQPSRTQKLVSKNLLVRKHPEHEQSLLIDALIINEEPEAVAFPLLYLRFSDINDQELAGRIFHPPEYLKGELLGHTLPPPHQPVHISLSIVDPGSAAVNYSLQLLGRVSAP